MTSGSNESIVERRARMPTKENVSLKALAAASVESGFGRASDRKRTFGWYGSVLSRKLLSPRFALIGERKVTSQSRGKRRTMWCFRDTWDSHCTSEM